MSIHTESEKNMIIKMLKELKSLKQLTNQQIADLSGVPLSTVSRIFNGQTENPNIQTIADIVGAMGGSLDELLGIRQPFPQETPAPKEVPVQHDAPPQKEHPNYSEMIDLYKEIIHSKDETIRSKDKAIKIMGGMLIGVFVIILLVLIIDVLNGGFGFVRY